MKEWQALVPTNKKTVFGALSFFGALANAVSSRQNVFAKFHE